MTKGEVAKSREMSEELSDPDAVVYKIDLPANRYDGLGDTCASCGMVGDVIWSSEVS